MLRRRSRQNMNNESTYSQYYCDIDNPIDLFLQDALVLGGNPIATRNRNKTNRSIEDILSEALNIVKESQQLLLEQQQRQLLIGNKNEKNRNRVKLDNNKIDDSA